MVQYKRKPILADPPKTFRNDAEVWVMGATGEVFGTYEAYLHRLDYYNQRKFTCEITGHTNLNFFEALKSERHGSAEIDSTFPDQLREPILRSVQFSTIGRIDDLVNTLYETFREDFFLGEHVQILVEEFKDANEKVEGVVREKAYFPEDRFPDGRLARPEIVRYFVSLDGDTTREALVDSKHIFRERRYFNKQVLRSFLKRTITRERWEGAPWIVKESIARSYGIEATVPPGLQYDNVMAERRAFAALKKGRPDEQCLEFFQHEIPGLAEATKAYKGKLPPELVMHFQDTLAGKVSPMALPPGLLPNGSIPQSDSRRKAQPAAPPPPPVVVVKYPIEDLELHPRRAFEHRPDLKYFPSLSEDKNSPLPGGWKRIDQKSVGSLLEIWNTLNVHSEFFVVDTFTFDDFVDALLFNVEDVDCELFSEIHCALLKTLVDEKGNVDPTVPNPADEDDDEEEEQDSAESSTVSTPAPQVTPRQSGRLIRTSLLRNDISEQLRTETNGHAAPELPEHRAETMLAGRDWANRLAAREFAAGGWQTIVVGLLHQLTLASKQRDNLHEILAHLAPISQKPTLETARRQYTTLDVNLRITVLQSLTMLAVTSRVLKDSMEERVGAMTDIRKEKVSMQREKKTLMEDIHALSEERRPFQPDPQGMSVETSINGTSVIEKSELREDDDSNPDTDDDGPRRGRRVNELKRKREIEEEQRKEKQKQAKLETSAASQYKRITKEIQKKENDIKDCEQQILDREEQLKLQSCHRTKVLGRDRFWNRYYWFERNGMPFAGSEKSSTAANGYANGRLWVQGADAMEREGFIDLAPDEAAQYSLAFGMSVQKREEIEYGPTRLGSAWDWAFYDAPEDIDKLISWLDDRGNRERALRKELQLWRDPIVEQMNAMSLHLTKVAEAKAKSEEPVIGIATRKKTYVDHNATKYPCLAWTNSEAKRQFGQLHSDGPMKKVAKGNVKGKAQPAVVERTATRSSGRLR